MRSIPSLSALFAGVVLTGLVACEPSDPTALGTGPAVVEATGAATAAARGRDNGNVSVPITMRAALAWTVPGASADDCPDLVDPGTGELFTAAGQGTGRANHLGRLRVTRMDHPTMNLCPILEGLPPAPEGLARTGQIELVAADGSTLSGRYDFLFVPPELGGFFTMTVQMGTGRFQGASGQLDFNWDESGEVMCSDPLCLEEATIDPMVFEGAIILPRP
jgi:hypothetical protein